MTDGFVLKTFEQVLAEIGSNRAKHLLLGNGFSIACDRKFDYGKLYQKAVEAGLPDSAKTLFEFFGTNNFEAVLRYLSDASSLAQLYGPLAQAVGLAKVVDNDYHAIKEALISAVASNHLNHTGELSPEKKASCAGFLKPFQSIFTTNYDLLLYWVEMAHLRALEGRDGFRKDPDDPEAPYCVFTERVGGDKGIYFIHGGLHLFVVGGEVRKHVWRGETPLMQRVRAALDARQFPLFVAEGDHTKKLEQIQRNGYLSYAFGKFGRIESPLLTCGLSFSEADQHLLEAIARNSKLPALFVGVYPPDKDGTTAIRASVSRLKTRRKRLEKALHLRDLTVSFWDTRTANVWG